MKNSLIVALAASSILLMSSCDKKNQPATTLQLASPDSSISLSFMLNDSLSPMYKVAYSGTTVIDNSTLGITFKDLPALVKGFQVDSSATKAIREVWKPKLGQYKYVKN